MARGTLADIEYRAAAPSDLAPRRCAAWGCQNLTQRSARNGLSDTLCKRHVEFRRRHGTHWRRSYTMAELGPFQAAARLWLKTHRDEATVVRVVSALGDLIAGSGGPRKAQEARWLSTEEKVRNALARLREAGKRGEQLLLITLTVKAAQLALGPRANVEFQHVQIAKMAHRLASGTHFRSAKYRTLSRYPRAEGIFMRLLGQTIEDIAGIVADSEAVREVAEAAGGRLDAV